jgi:hypothetical protein
VVHIPAEFQEVARLSHEERSENGSPRAGAMTVGEVTEELMAEYATRQPRPLVIAMDKLDDDCFRRLTGWVLFGRDYSPDDGAPYELLEHYIRTAVVRPREAQSGYLEGKPIGKYLRRATEHLSGNTQSDIYDEDDEEYE